MEPMNELKLWSDSEDLFFAHNLADIDQMYVEQNGDTYKNMTGEVVEESFYPLELDVFTVRFEDSAEIIAGKSVPTGATVSGMCATASLDDWRRLNGTGFFASYNC